MHSKAQSSTVKKALVLAAFAFSVLTSHGIAGWLPSLSEKQRQAIHASTLQRASVAPRSKPASIAAHPLGVQILLIEPKERKNKSAQSSLLVEVFSFDYQSLSASLDIVEANTGELISTRVLNTRYLPLNPTESDYAIQLLQEHGKLFDLLSTEYLQQFGESLTEQHQIDMKVSIWTPESRLPASSGCGQSRCALVSVFTPDHFNFSVEPVVDLVSGEIFLEGHQ